MKFAIVLGLLSAAIFAATPVTTPTTHTVVKKIVKADTTVTVVIKADTVKTTTIAYDTLLVTQTIKDTSLVVSTKVDTLKQKAIVKVKK
jgi:hypothetical protein